MTRRETAGTIVYRTTFVRNPSYAPQGRDLFSDDFLWEIRRANVPEWRTVHFDGTHSRTEETNGDYNVRSDAIELRTAGSETVTYCKTLRFVRFCVERPIPRPDGGPPAHFEPLGEMATIAGMRCRTGQSLGARRLHVWYAEDLEILDPTGAVLQLEGVPGTILQTEEIADSNRVDAVRRVAVAELSFIPPSPSLFARPEDYRFVGHVGVALAEDRRMLDAQRGGPEPFVGTWELERPRDRIVMEISGDLRVRTTVVTAPADTAGRIRDEQAAVRGNLFVVDDPPNGRAYALSDDGQTLTRADNDVFTFRRRR